MNNETGKIVIGIGLIIMLIGIIIYLFHDKLHWIGNLPGDIRLEKKNIKFYFPLTTMILVSIVLSLIVQIIKRLF